MTRVLRRALGRLRVAARTGADEGAVSIFVLGLTVTLLVLGGLVIDGGNRVNSEMTLADDTEQAARAGATAIDEDALRVGGKVVLNRDDAQRRTTTYLTGLGYPQPVVTFSADGLTVNVASRSTVKTQMLSLIGIGDFDITATASASAEVGIG